MICGRQRKCSESMTTPGNFWNAMSYRLLSGSNRVRYLGTMARCSSSRSKTCWRFRPTFSGLVCLSSPTTIVFLARASRGSASSPICEASSTISTSNGGSVSGRKLVSARAVGMIQTGTASLDSSSAARISASQRCANLPPVFPYRVTART